PSPLGHHRVGFEVAVAHMHEGARRLTETEVDVPSQRILVEGGAAAVRHELEAGSGRLLEVDPGDLRATDAHRARWGFTGTFLQPGDQFAQVLRRQGLARNDPLRRVR